MELTISPDLEEFVKGRVESGAFPDESSVIEEGLRKLRGDAILSSYSQEELNAMMATGERDFENGNFIEWTDNEHERLWREVQRELGNKSRPAKR